MIEVALETSTRQPSVAVRDATRVIERRLDRNGSHASDLLPALEALLAECDATPRDITRIAVGIGPGSYTGLRVGIATAQGLARGTGAPLVGVPSGEALAYAQCRPGEDVVHLLDARSGELYFAHYARDADGLRIVTAPRVVKPDELVGSLPDGVRILGDATCADAAGLDAEARARLDDDVVPTATAVLALGATREAAQAPEAVLPLYLRPFAAKVRKR